MPSLRNHHKPAGGSQDPGPVFEVVKQNAKESPSDANSHQAKVQIQEVDLSEEQPSSPRRLRDRRLLTGPKTDSTPSSQLTPQGKSCQKIDTQSQPSSGDNHQNNAQACKRSQPLLETDQPPKTQSKKSPGKAESLLAKVHPKPSASSPVPKKNNDLSINDLAHSSASKQSISRGSSLLAPTPKSIKQGASPSAGHHLLKISPTKSATSSPIRSSDISQRHQRSPSQTQHQPKQSTSNQQDNDCQVFDGPGLNFIKRREPITNETDGPNQHSPEASPSKIVTFSSQPTERRSSSSTATQSRSRSSQSNMMATSPKVHHPRDGVNNNHVELRNQNFRIAPPSDRPINASLIQSGSKRSMKYTNQPAGSIINHTTNNDLASTLANQLEGAINMTKSTSKIKPFNVLIAITGSVASIKLIELIRKLRSAFPRSFTRNNQTYKATIAIKVVMTENSKHFVPKEEIIRECEHTPGFAIFDDSDEWNSWGGIGDPVLHIELRKWADLCLIAPLDANTMAKLANGICDNLLTCTIRAWDTSKPLIYCPAMNVHMWTHPITKDHLTRLESFGYQRVDCIEKRLACGDVGFGAMAAVDTIVGKVVECLLWPSPKPSSLLRPKQSATYQMMPSMSKSSETTISRLYKEASSLMNSLKQAEISDLKRSNNDCDVNGDTSKSTNQVPFSLQNLKAMDLERRSESLNDLVDGTQLGASDEIFQEAILKNFIQSSDLIGPGKSFTTINGLSSGSVTNGSLVKNVRGHRSKDPSAYITQCYNKSRNCFTCIICKNDYKNRKSMSRHLKEQHLQGNIHQCLPCGVSYKRREKLIKHNLECHGSR